MKCVYPPINLITLLVKDTTLQGKWLKYVRQPDNNNSNDKNENVKGTNNNNDKVKE